MRTLSQDVHKNTGCQAHGDFLIKVSYNNLWKIMIDRNMQKKDLIDELGIGLTTIAKMGKGKKVSLDVLERTYSCFDCNIGGVMSFEKDDNWKSERNKLQ